MSGSSLSDLSRMETKHELTWMDSFDSFDPDDLIFDIFDQICLYLSHRYTSRFPCSINFLAA